MEDITDITNGLNIIKQLKPKLYIKVNHFHEDIENEKEAGLIAEDILQSDISFSVRGGEYINELGEHIKIPYTVINTNVIAYLISAVQELSARQEQQLNN